MIEVLAAGLIVLVAIIVYLLVRQSDAAGLGSAPTILLQKQVESLRHDVHESLRTIGENMNQQLGIVTQQLQSQTSTVGTRLDSATRVIGDVQRNLGELGRATQEIKELGQSVTRLDEILRAPKLRGSLGEFLLEDLLRQVLPAQHFSLQHHFQNGCVVDAVVRTADRLVPIDAKFPLENFRRMVESAAEDDRRVFQRAFLADVKRHVDDIATKYILPDEGTFPFALLYIPAENVYYEVIVKDDVATNGTSLYHYALERKVIPVSPNSFYAYLQVIVLGLRGLHVERSAREILSSLGRLQADVDRLREAFTTLGTHLENARKKYDESDRRLANFQVRLDGISGTAPTGGKQERDDAPVNTTQLLT